MLVSSYNYSCLLDLVSLKSATDFISGNCIVKLSLVTEGERDRLGDEHTHALYNGSVHDLIACNDLV